MSTHLIRLPITVSYPLEEGLIWLIFLLVKKILLQKKNILGAVFFTDIINCLLVYPFLSVVAEPRGVHSRLQPMFIGKYCWAIHPKSIFSSYSKNHAWLKYFIMQGHLFPFFPLPPHHLPKSPLGSIYQTSYLL